MIKRKEHEFFELNYLRHLRKADLKRCLFFFFFFSSLLSHGLWPLGDFLNFLFPKISS